jgi:hypothetical protein
MMSNSKGRFAVSLSIALALSGAGPALAQSSASVSSSSGSATEQHNLAELRDTVINLIQALVDRGVITREQAEAMIRDAKAKAEAEMAANAAREKAQAEADKGAVRVPYVPQIVQDQISKQVAAEIAPQVKQEVAAEVKSPETMHSVLPDWVWLMNWTGDVRMRGEADLYGRDNPAFTYLDFNQVNAAGGIVPAGAKAYWDTTQDVDRLRVRVRFGFDTELGDGWSTGVRLATGSGGEIFVSTNQTLGTYGQGYQMALDQGYLRWTGTTSTDRQILSLTAGRVGNPWVSTNMEWYNDLTFEGVLGNYRINLSDDNVHRDDLFVTAGAFPLQDVNSSLISSSQNKWLVGYQLGADLNSENDSRLRLAAAYYDYLHITGERNTPDSTLLNYTAPLLVQKGNTMYDIANSTNPDVNLFALAAHYRILDLIAMADWHAFDRYSVSLTANAVRNIGYSWQQILAETGQYVAPRINGYEADLGFGTLALNARGSWRVWVGYRYLQRDAVLDAFNDEDWHYGGTDMKGYQFMFDWVFNRYVWAHLRYMTANAIDGPPLSIDVLQLDLNTAF